MTTPLDILKQRWLTIPTLPPFVEVMNTAVMVEDLPDQWGSAIYSVDTRDDLTMGSAPWVMESGTLSVGLLCRSGVGRSTLDPAVAALRGAFHGYQTPDDQLHFVSVLGPIAADIDTGEWYRLDFAIPYRFRTRRAEPPLPVDPAAPDLPGP